MKTRTLTEIAVMTALLSVLSPISIPLSSLVPISLATLMVMLAGGITGAKNGTIAVLLYLLLGFLGFPVFAGWTGGAGILFGMTGGFLFGYLPLAWCTGLGFHGQESTAKRILGMLAGTLILYLLGTLWFMFFTSSSLMASLAACVIPFLPGDALKIAAVCLFAPRVSSALEESRKNRI
ncbi:MAG: biotin transporter BioY [Solobacterium sp.]|nr:biotin transporter BioY [Solobacterium sp.]